MLNFVDGWGIMNYFIYIGILLIVAKVIKEKVPFVNRIILPTALLAGFIGLILSDGFLNLIPLNRDGILYIMTDTGDGGYVLEKYSILKDIIYHMFAIGFISLALKRGVAKGTKKVWSTGMIIVMTYLIQAIIGAGVILILFKDTFLGAGLLLPLGFGQGPGLATSMGNIFEAGSGQLSEGGALGATIASIGFIIGGTVGVVTLNVLARKNNLTVNKPYDSADTMTEDSYKVEQVTISGNKELKILDALTINVIVILAIYFLAFGTLFLLNTFVFPNMGGIGNTFEGVFHGFNYLLGVLYAFAFRAILTKIEKSKNRKYDMLNNNFILSNISNLAFNILIVAAVLSITIESINEYWLQVIVMSLLAGVGTFIFLRFIIKRVYQKSLHVHYFVIMYGMLTGTMSTGVALLKGIDPKLETPVAEDIVLSNGTAIALALPLFAVLSFPGAQIDNPGAVWNIFGTEIGMYTALVFIVPIIFALILGAIVIYINRATYKENQSV
jgi:ESS family glutamate:Na+ symporter